MFKKRKENLASPNFNNDIPALAELVKKNNADSNKYFNILLSFLTDPLPENRIAACIALGETSRDVAFTHISHWVLTEKDENVVRAMKKAMVNIRKNMQQENIAKE